MQVEYAERRSQGMEQIKHGEFRDAKDLGMKETNFESIDWIGCYPEAEIVEWGGVAFKDKTIYEAWRDCKKWGNCLEEEIKNLTAQIGRQTTSKRNIDGTTVEDPVITIKEEFWTFNWS